MERILITIFGEVFNLMRKGVLVVKIFWYLTHLQLYINLKIVAFITFLTYNDIQELQNHFDEPNKRTIGIVSY